MTNTNESWPFDEVELNDDRFAVSFPELYTAFELQLQPVEDTGPTEQRAPNISTFELGIWLRHASSKVAHIGGHPACRLSTPPTVQVGSPLAEEGVHEPGSCADDGTGCVIHDAFGPGCGVSGQLNDRGIHVSTEVGPWADSTTSTGRDASVTGNELPSQTVTVRWRLTIDEDLAMLGLIAEGIDYLGSHAGEYQVRLGPSASIKATVRRAMLLNPLYTSLERLRALDNHSPTADMQRKNDEWKRILRPASVEALQARLSGGDGLHPAIHSGAAEGDGVGADHGDEGHTKERRRGDWAMSYWG